MRSLSATLKTAQESGGGTPYVPSTYDNGASDVSFASDMRRMRVVLEQYAGYGTIVVNNSAGTYDSFNYKGKAVKISPGYVTGGGNESSSWPWFYIDGYTWVGDPGRSDAVFHLITNFEKLLRSRENRGAGAGTGEYVYNDVGVIRGGTGLTLKGIISDLCTQAGVTLGTSVSEDSVIDAKKPFMFIIPKDEDRLTSILRLLKQSECELILQAGEVKLIHPQDSDAVVATYERNPSLTDHLHLFSELRTETAFAPNKVTVISSTNRLAIDNVSGTFQVGEVLNNTTTGASATITIVSGAYLEFVDYDLEYSWNNNDSLQGATSGATALCNGDPPLSFPETTGSYTHADAANVGTWDHVEVLPAFDKQYTSAECAAMARDMVEREERKARYGQIVTTVNCGLEIWDMVSVVNPWTGKTLSKGRVGRLELRYDKTQKVGVYRMAIGVGGYQGEPDPDRMPADMIVPEPQAPVDTSIMVGSTETTRRLLASALRQSTQKYTVDIDFHSKDNDEIYWDAGKIIFEDGSVLTTDARAVGSAYTLTDDVHWVYFEEGDSTLKVTANPFVPNGPNRGVLAAAYKTSDTDQKAAILSSDGKTAIINGSLICANAIVTNLLAAGAVTADKMTIVGVDGAGKLVLGQIGSGDLDDVDDGSSNLSLKKPDTDLSTLGIAIKSGTGSTRTEMTGSYIRGLNAGVEQFKLDASDGKAKAGGGNVVLDANGLTVTDGYLLFYEGAAKRGEILGYDTLFLIDAQGVSLKLRSSSNDIDLSCPGDVNVAADSLDLYGGGVYATPLKITHLRQATRPGYADLEIGEIAVWEDSDAEDCEVLYRDEDGDLYAADMNKVDGPP